MFFFTNTVENVSPSTIAGYCGLREVTQKSRAQGSAEIAHVSWNASKASEPKCCLQPVPSALPRSHGASPPSCPAAPSTALTATAPPEHLVGKELLQSLSTQPSCLQLLASLISSLPFHQGLSLSKEVGQKDLAHRNKHKLPFCIAGILVPGAWTHTKT